MPFNLPNKSTIAGFEAWHKGNHGSTGNFHPQYLYIEPILITKNSASNTKWAKFIEMFLNVNATNSFVFSLIQGGNSLGISQFGMIFIKVTTGTDINTRTVHMSSLNDEGFGNENLAYRIIDNKIEFYIRSSVLDADLVMQKLSQKVESGFELFTSPVYEIRSDVIQNPYRKQGTTAQRPTNVPVSFCYYDRSIGKPIWWNGTQWQLATGVTA